MIVIATESLSNSRISSFAVIATIPVPRPRARRRCMKMLSSPSSACHRGQQPIALRQQTDALSGTNSGGVATLDEQIFIPGGGLGNAHRFAVGHRERISTTVRKCALAVSPVF